MDIIDNLIKEVNNPKTESAEETTISNVKKFTSFGIFFIVLWIILVLVGTNAGIKGDDGTRFGVFLFSAGLSVLSEIIGIWLLFREYDYTKNLQNKDSSKKALKGLKLVSMILILSPLLFVIVGQIIASIVVIKPFSGA